MSNKTYEELISILSFEDRLKYLKIDSFVGEKTFGSLRSLNQKFYSSREWLEVRQQILFRDYGYDLAHNEHPIIGPLYVHHIIPITPKLLLDKSHLLLDPNNLITVSFDTHQTIHFNKKMILDGGFLERKKNDTKLW